MSNIEVNQTLEQIISAVNAYRDIEILYGHVRKVIDKNASIICGLENLEKDSGIHDHRLVTILSIVKDYFDIRNRITKERILKILEINSNEAIYPGESFDVSIHKEDFERLAGDLRGMLLGEIYQNAPITEEEQRQIDFVAGEVETVNGSE